MLLFTSCLIYITSCAVHIEVKQQTLHMVEAFIGRIGPITEISSDQGTNFVGADSEFK